MAIYKIEGNNEKLVKVETTSLGEEDVWERRLQRMLRDRPEALEEGLLIISEEFSRWQDSNRKIDLLGLDEKNRLVVIELKRGDTGAHMDLQAIRYAAMVANMTYEQAVETYQEYLNKRAKEGGDEPDDAGDKIQKHLERHQVSDQTIHTESPRIILASENFSKELTTCVMWLNNSWLSSGGPEIKCVRLQPHKNGCEVLVESSVVIPLPEASDYQTQLKKLEQETRSEMSERAGKTETHQGADAFEKSIERASETFRPGLKLLYQAAKSAEQKKTAELSTTVGAENYTINLKVPGHDNVLITFTNILRYKGKECGGEIAFLPGLADAAPESSPRIEKLIDAADLGVTRYRRLSVKKYDWEAILSAIGDAYREISGIPPTQEE